MLAQFTHRWSRYQTLGIADGGMSMRIYSLTAVAFALVTSRKIEKREGANRSTTLARSRHYCLVARLSPLGGSRRASSAISFSEGMPLGGHRRSNQAGRPALDMLAGSLVVYPT